MGRGRLIVMEFKVRFFPDEEIVNYIQGANSQNLGYLCLREDFCGDEYFP